MRIDGRRAPFLWRLVEACPDGALVGRYDARAGVWVDGRGEPLVLGDPTAARTQTITKVVADPSDPD